MRKCQACGYLLLGDREHCNHCGAVLPEPALSAVIAPATVGAGAPLPAPVPPTLLPPPPPPPSAGRAPVARDNWMPPAPSGAPVAPKSTASKPLATRALIVVVSMAVGWFAVGHFLSHDSLPAGTSAYVAGHGVSFSSPDHTFDARFPSTPTVRRQVITVSTASATLNLAQVQTDDYEVVAASMLMPFSLPPSQVGTVLHDILDGGVVATDGKVVSEQHVVRDGVQGIEIRAKVPDGYAARIMVLSSGRRIYMLGVHAKSGTDRLYDALVESLVMY